MGLSKKNNTTLALRADLASVGIANLNWTCLRFAVFQEDTPWSFLSLYELSAIFDGSHQLCICFKREYPMHSGH